MTTEEQVRILSTFCERDEAGRHFTQRYPDEALGDLESEGLIEIGRPVHPGTGLSYAREYWHAEVTPDGVDLVERYPEYHDND